MPALTRRPRLRSRWLVAVTVSVLALLVAPVAYSLSSSARSLGSAGSSDPSGQFTISGRAVRPVWPGKLSPMNLKFTNHTSQTLAIRHIKVTMQSVTAPRADAQHPCTRADFRVKQAGRGTVITVPANSTERLKQAGIRGRKWPAVGLFDLRTNQDGCQGATFALTYSATGRAR